MRMTLTLYLLLAAACSTPILPGSEPAGECFCPSYPNAIVNIELGCTETPTGFQLAGAGCGDAMPIPENGSGHLEFAGAGPGACHVTVTLPSGFVYTADVEFSEVRGPGGCGCTELVASPASLSSECSADAGHD
jgi:hypothetical protein